MDELDSMASAPAGVFPGGDAAPEQGELRIAWDKRPYAAVLAHGARDPEVEICGVLVGRVATDRHGCFVQVTHAIEGVGAAEQGAHVTFTHDTWNHINAEMDRLHSGPEGRRIVGWYHTHPDFGVFLSDMDLFIHQNFFAQSWQLAYVYDPLSGNEGLFRLVDGKLCSADRYWLGGRQRRIAAGKDAAPASSPADTNVALTRALTVLTQSLTESRERSSASWPPLSWIIAGMVGLFAVLQLSGGLGQRDHSDPAAMLILDKDPRSGVGLGVRVYPVAASDGELVPLYKDARSDQYYGVVLERADKAGLPDLKQVLAAATQPDPKPSASDGASGSTTLSRAWIALPIIAAVILAVFATVAGLARRKRREGRGAP